MDDNIVFGRNAVKELLAGDREIDRIIAVKDSGRNADLVAEAKKKHIPVITAEKQKLDKITEKANHQGIAAVISEVRYADISDILALAKSRGEAPFVIILDSVTDPHNLGAIMRTACSAGCHGIIMSKRRCCPINGTAAKVASGAAEHLLISRVPNLAAAIDELKKEGLWITGGDMYGEKNVFEADFSGPIGIVVGNEGEGISRLIKEKCDFLVNIPMPGPTESLNVSVACGILIYEVLRGRL